MPDDRIRTAVDRWGPRFVANGVDMNDFFRITGSVERWEDWCGAWSRAGAEAAELGERAESSGYFSSAAEHFVRAALMYHFGKFLFFDDLEQHETAHRQTVALYRRALPYLDPPGKVVSIPFGRSAMPGILRKPAHVRRPAVVILVPGLDSVKEENHALAQDFLRRGMATLSIDGPGQGELEADHAIRPDFEVPIRAVVDWTRQRADLDGNRIGLVGRSLGGYYAVRAAAGEPRLRAAISIAGGVNIAADFPRMPSLTRAAFTFHLRAANEAAAQEMLKRFDLTDSIQRLQCPLLTIMGGRDRIFTPESARDLVAAAAGRAELMLLDDGNHGCNNVAYKYRPAQADWMRRKLEDKRRDG